MSFRFFDAETGQWSIYWADSRRCGMLDPPVFGSFDGGVGLFEGAGRVRRAADPRALHVVARRRRRTPRWEQAFSADGGETLGDQLGHGLRPRGGRPMSALDAAGEVAPDYEHVDQGRSARGPPSRPAAPSSSGTTSPRATRPVPRGDPASWRGEALDAVAVDAALAGELGFVILHRCGESFYFLLVSTWRNENELWETVWAKAGRRTSRPSRPWPLEGAAPADVLRLGAARGLPRAGAWSRYLRSARDAVAKREYLGDAYTGSA